ncbi:MAG: hypothetical protein WEB51_05920 [Mycobacterium sp.]
MTEETDEQILARYRERWHDPFLTMSAALDRDNTRRRFANLGALKREKEAPKAKTSWSAFGARFSPRAEVLVLELDIAGDIKFWKDTVVQRTAKSCLITTRSRIPDTATPVERFGVRRGRSLSEPDATV